MKLCDNDCIPCCDFCIHAIYEMIDFNYGFIVGGPIGCKLHKDQEHQDEAESCGHCEDFYCINVEV